MEARARTSARSRDGVWVITEGLRAKVCMDIPTACWAWTNDDVGVGACTHNVCTARCVAWRAFSCPDTPWYLGEAWVMGDGGW